MTNHDETAELSGGRHSGCGEGGGVAAGTGGAGGGAYAEPGGAGGGTPAAPAVGEEGQTSGPGHQQSGTDAAVRTQPESVTRRKRRTGPDDGRPERACPPAPPIGADADCGPQVPDATVAFTAHGAPTDFGGRHRVTLRTPEELADALPYLLGYRPEDSVVLLAVHESEEDGRFGGRARLGIPARAEGWAGAAEQLTHGLLSGSVRRGHRPDSFVAFLCQEPSPGETAQEVMERLRPLAQALRTTSGREDVPVVEALCLSGGRFWSYCCPGNGCCPPEGKTMGVPGTSVLAAAATYMGMTVRGSLRELRARLTPWEAGDARRQEAALDKANANIVPRILTDEGRADIASGTLALAERLITRLAAAPGVTGTEAADEQDDRLVTHDEAAALILGLQDRTTRDRAAEWMEGDEAAPALRLWRTLARRCVGAYGEHAAPPLTLAGWVAWSSGDELEAREALSMALAADPEYLFARLLHQACNEGLNPESIRRCLRRERDDRGGAASVTAADGVEREGRAADSPGGRISTVPAQRAASADHDYADPESRPGARERTQLTECSAQPLPPEACRRRSFRSGDGTGSRAPRRPSGQTAARRTKPTGSGAPDTGTGPRGRTPSSGGSRARGRRRADSSDGTSDT